MPGRRSTKLRPVSTASMVTVSISVSGATLKTTFHYVDGRPEKRGATISFSENLYHIMENNS
jgi:hypothetical protein